MLKQSTNMCRLRHWARALIAGLLLLPGFAAAQSFTHVHLRVPDTDGAAQWYQSLLGGEFRPGGMASARYENGFIGTMPDDTDPVGSGGSVIDHMGFSVDDMDAVIERVRGTGYDYHELRPARPGSTTLLMFFEGADGMHFEIAQPNGVAAE